MADVFRFEDTTTLLNNKFVMFLGDSNTRAQYKDLVWLLNENTLIKESYLRKKLEDSYLGDKLVSRGTLNRGRDFQEVREYNDGRTKVGFMFIPRCFDHNIEQLFMDFKNGYKPMPDVIVINSCMWDLTRWGPNGVPAYKDNMVKLMRLISRTLPLESLVIWTTALPTAAHVRGGLIIKQIKCMEPLLRFEVMEANTFARDLVSKHGFDVLDFHFFNRMQIHRRKKDGIHFGPVPVRFMTNLLLTHIALSWDCRLPGNANTILLRKAISQNCTPKQEVVKLPTGGIFSRLIQESPDKSKSRGLSIVITAGRDRSRQCTIVGEPQKKLASSDSSDAPRSILHRLGNQPIEINRPTNPMDSRPILQRLGSVPCQKSTQQSGPSNPPRIFSRLGAWNLPDFQTGMLLTTNQQTGGPIRNKKKKRRNHFYQGSGSYHYNY